MSYQFEVPPLEVEPGEYVGLVSLCKEDGSFETVMRVFTVPPEVEGAYERFAHVAEQVAHGLSDAVERHPLVDTTAVQ